jgi:hypothetical protein
LPVDDVFPISYDIRDHARGDPLALAGRVQKEPAERLSRSEIRARVARAPTLAQLGRGWPWTWVVCERCLHRKPIAFTTLITRWGPDASSDLIRRSARCEKCGAKGARLQHPRWIGMDVGWEPFPTE